MAIVFVLLGLAGGAFLWNVADKSPDLASQPKSTLKSESTIIAGPILTCTRSETFCTMQFQPSKCVLNLKGKEREFAGNNICQAKQHALKELCSEGVTELTVTEWNSLSCKQISE
jgi:hypothetical protein